MPNLNFTSSSFAQQDRYAQTTVSYESRHMQSIPFYPGVDHKAKLRGIMAMAIVIAIVAGAILGTLFGLRDYLVDFAKQTPIYSAIVDGEETPTPPPVDEEMNVSLAAFDYGYTDIVVVNDGKSTKEVTYNGMNHSISWGISKDVTDPGEVNVEFAWMRSKDGNGKSVTDSYKSVDVYGWPKNAGTYLINASITGEKIASTDKTITLVIKQATVEYPGLIIPEYDELMYDGTVKSVKIEKSLPADYTGSCNILYNGSKQTVMKNAGTYTLGVSIGGDNNYKASTYTGTTVTVRKSNVILPSDFAEAFADKTVKYDAVQNASKYPELYKDITIDVNKLPADFPKDLKDEIVNGCVSYAKVVENPVNVGTYTITAKFNSKNYEINDITATLTIEKADLSDYFKFPAVNVVYTGTPVTNGITITEQAGFPDVIEEGISISYTYYSVKGNNRTLITKEEIINAGNYEVDVKFSQNVPNYITPDDFTVKITVKKADIDLSKVVVNPISATYSGGKISFKASDVIGLPQGVKADVSKAFATNAGTHSVVIKLVCENGKENYNPAEILGEIKIAKAQFGYVNVTAKVIQKVAKDGKVHLPAWTGELPEGAWVDYYVGGKQIEGIDRLGTYDVSIVVTDENHYYEIPVKFSLTFNFLTIVMGIVVGIVIALIVAPIIWLSYRRIEAQSFKKFARLRARILHERGGARGAIVCEGRVTIINWNSEQEHRDFPWIVEPRWGRLYLTHATLEYYDGDYKKNYRNHLVELKDVTGVEIRGVFLRNKLIVFAKGGRFVYYVEPNTAYLWRRDILHFRNLQHLYPMENNIVDNDYPFNYTVITDGD